jgi:hypothetical protein
MNPFAIAGLILAASILTPSAFLIYDNTTAPTTSAPTQADDLGIQINDIMNKTDTILNQTNSFLDHAWGIAQKFQDPNYEYDPSQVGNFTIPTIPSPTPNTTTNIQLTITN